MQGSQCDQADVAGSKTRLRVIVGCAFATEKSKRAKSEAATPHRLEHMVGDDVWPMPRLGSGLPRQAEGGSLYPLVARYVPRIPHRIPAEDVLCSPVATVRTSATHAAQRDLPDRALAGADMPEICQFRDFAEAVRSVWLRNPLPLVRATKWLPGPDSNQRPTG
jgi:hypothetical protein